MGFERGKRANDLPVRSAITRTSIFIVQSGSDFPFPFTYLTIIRLDLCPPLHHVWRDIVSCQKGTSASKSPRSNHRANLLTSSVATACDVAGSSSTRCHIIDRGADESCVTTTTTLPRPKQAPKQANQACFLLKAVGGGYLKSVCRPDWTSDVGELVVSCPNRPTKHVFSLKRWEEKRMSPRLDIRCW